MKDSTISKLLVERESILASLKRAKERKESWPKFAPAITKQTDLDLIRHLLAKLEKVNLQIERNK